jgi:hypothetical protein
MVAVSKLSALQAFAASVIRIPTAEQRPHERFRHFLLSAAEWTGEYIRMGQFVRAQAVLQHPLRTFLSRNRFKIHYSLTPRFLGISTAKKSFNKAN